jgi:hypothetical protein
MVAWAWGLKCRGWIEGVGQTREAEVKNGEWGVGRGTRCKRDIEGGGDGERR